MTSVASAAECAERSENTEHAALFFFGRVNADEGGEAGDGERGADG